MSRAALALVLLVPLAAAQEGAGTPEELFLGARESVLAGDWARFRRLIDRAAYEPDLAHSKEWIASLPEDQRQRAVAWLGFESFEDLQSTGLDAWLDHVLPGRVGQSLAKMFERHDISIRLAADRESVEGDLGSSEEETYRLKARRREGRWFLSPGVATVPAEEAARDDPIRALMDDLKADVLRSFRVAAPGADRVRWRSDVAPAALDFPLPREGATWVPADAVGAPPAGEPVFRTPGGLAFRWRIERVAGDLYRIVIHVYEGYDPRTANEPVRVVSTMVAAN